MSFHPRRTVPGYPVCAHDLPKTVVVCCIQANYWKSFASMMSVPAVPRRGRKPCIVESD